MIDFTAVQVHIKERGPEKAVTLMARASMMRIAERIAQREQASVLITGECLGQVASQTPESLAFTGSFVLLPVLRPLIGMDKIEIIERARAMGTFDISTRPYDDCCILFAPEHPLIKPDTARLTEEYRTLEMEKLLEEAAAGREQIVFTEHTGRDDYRESPT